MSGPHPRTARCHRPGPLDLPPSPSTTRPSDLDQPGSGRDRPGALIGRGLAHEALEVIRCLRNGETESPLVPLDETVAVMRQMDRIRGADRSGYAADRAGDSG